MESIMTKSNATLGRYAPALGMLAVLLLTPLTAFSLMQFVYCGASTYPLGVLLANYLCVAVLFFPLCALTRQVAWCSVLIHGLAALWGAANVFVSQFRGTPVLPWDFTALGTATAVAGNYRLVPTPRMLMAAVLVILLGVFLPRLLPRSLFPSTGRGWFYRIVLLGVGLLCLIPVSQPARLEQMGIKTDVWDPSGAYRDQGALAEFLGNLKFLSVETPEGYSPDVLSRIEAQLSCNPSSAALPVQRPNIVAIMNESWADFEEYGHLSLSESVTDYISALPGIHGHANTSVFGAGTSASEFEFLTGNSMAFLPSGSIPYQQYVLGPTDSLASRLKDQGYHTLAIHPGERTSWQRNRAYPRLGFDTFKCVEDFNVPLTQLHGYVSDYSDFEQIIYEFDHKDPGKPLFLFNVTIQNHGGYTDPDYPAQVTLTDQSGVFPMAEQYLSLANQTDQDFQLLVDYFQTQEEPTILIMFGDHPPALEQGFLDLAYGAAQDEMTMDQYLSKFRVPFVIWANYPLPEKTIETTSLNFLGETLLTYAGIPTTGYGQFLHEMQTNLPSLTFVGYLDAQGQAHSHLETNNYTDQIWTYSVVQYNNVFGGKDRRSTFFSESLP